MKKESLILDFLRFEDTFIINCKGFINTVEIKKLEKVLEIIKEQGFEEVIINFSKVTYRDEMSLDALEKFYRNTLPMGINVKLVIDFNSPLFFVLKKRLPQFSLIIFPDLNTALNSFYNEFSSFYYDINKIFFKGQVFQISFPYKGKQYIFYSQLQKVDEKYLIFIWPRDKDKNLYHLPDSRISFTFLSIKGIFTFQQEIIKKSLDPTPPIFIIKKPALENIKKVNRRLFKRIPYKSILNYKLLDKNSIPLDTIYQGKTLDLSAGGISFETTYNIPLFSYIYLYLILPQKNLQNIIGKIIRTTFRSPVFSYGIKFISIFEEDRNKILDYINQKNIK